MNDDKKIKYKKLETSVSSDPNRMYVNNDSDSENEENDCKSADLNKYLKKSDGIMKDLYNIFIGKKEKKKNKDNNIECSNISIDTELEDGYVSVILGSNKSGVIENYLDNSTNQIKINTELEQLDDKPIDINKSYFECFEDTKSINNVVNYKDETINFGYDSAYYNEIKTPVVDINQEFLPKSDYNDEAKVLNKSHENDKYIGKYSIYALSTIIVMSSAYIVGTL